MPVTFPTFISHPQSLRRRPRTKIEATGGAQYQSQLPEGIPDLTVRNPDMIEASHFHAMGHREQ